MNPSPTIAGRDPVCESIEELLRDLEARGKGRLQRSDQDECVQLRFNDAAVAGPTYEIALVRLASAMIDDRHLAPRIMNALREPMAASVG